MVDVEAKSMNSRASNRTGPFAGFAGQAAEVTGDFLELAELQAKLARLDARDALRRVVGPLGMMVFAACVAIASLPVVFLGIAGGIAETADIPPWLANLVVGFIGALVALVVAWIALRTITTALDSFKRSTDELAKNVAWFKSIFRRT